MKKSTLFIVLIFIFYSFSVFSQNTFEITIPWGGDTSVMVHHGMETPEGDFVLFTVNYQTNKVRREGFSCGGPNMYGYGLMKISSDGEVVWKRRYSHRADNCNDFGFPNYFGVQRTPILDDGDIILGLEAFGNFSKKISGEAILVGGTKGFSLLRVDGKTGVLERRKIFVGDTGSSQERIESFAVVDDEILMFTYNEHYKRYYLKTFDKTFFMPLQNRKLEKDVFDNVKVRYDDYSELFLSAKQFQLNFYDEGGRLCRTYKQEDVDKDPVIVATGYSKTVSNGNYYAGIVRGRKGGSSGVLFVFSNEGEFIAKRIFPFETILDVAITPSDEVLILTDNSTPRRDDTTSLTIKIRSFDFQLKPIASKDYGHRKVTPKSLGITTDNRFFVVGTRGKTNFDTDEIESQKVYLLVEKVSDLEPDKSASKILIFNNPILEELYINNGSDYVSLDFELFDLQGAKIYDKTVFREMSYGMDNVPNGVYIYRFLDADGYVVRSGKLVKN